VRYSDVDTDWSGWSPTANADFTTAAAALGDTLNTGWNMISMSQIYTTAAGGTLTNSAQQLFADDTGLYSANTFLIEWDNQNAVADNSWNCGSCGWTGNVASGSLNAVQGYFFYGNASGQTLTLDGGDYADMISVPLTVVDYDLTNPGAHIVGNPFSIALPLDPASAGVNGVFIVRDGVEKPFSQAAAPPNSWVEADIYYYVDSQTGYSQMHCGDSGNNEITQWVGYWIRLKALDTDTSSYKIRFRKN
jgi:hypothetical protein